MRIFVFFLASSVAFAAGAHEDKKYSFGKTPPPRTIGFCEEIMVGKDWEQPLLRDQTELRKLFDGRPTNPMWVAWRSAVRAFPKMEEFVNRLPAEKRAYFQTILNGVGAGLTKHQLNFARPRDLSKLDLERHMTLLRAAAGFSEENAEFSLYKMKRAIEGRYSLKEYTDCE